MKKLILTTFLLFSSVLTFSQWISNFGGSGDVNLDNAKGNSVTTDADGNSYVTGYSNETGSGNDVLVIKYSETGSITWAVNYPGSANMDDVGHGICVDSYGNVYVVGTAQMSGKSYEVILLKYDSEGNLVWQQVYGKTDYAKPDVGLDIAVDANSNIYITGYVTNDNNLKEIFVSKCNPNGTIDWTRNENGTSDLDAEGLTIQVGSTGNVFVAGYITVSGTNTDMVIVKYNSLGDQEWIRSVNGSGNGEDRAWGIVVDSYDNVFITGSATNSYGNADCYTVKFNSDGTTAWEMPYNGGGNGEDKAWGVVVDTDGNTYVAGETTDENGNVNYVTLRYNSDGSQAWVSFYNGTGNDIDKASAIGLLGTNSVVVTGKSWGTSQTYDYATVRYNTSTGTMTQFSRYTFNGISNDCAKDVAVSVDNKVIITGYSELIMESSVEHSYLTSLEPSWVEATDITNGNNLPSKFSLYQNYPNPFNPSTTIKFDLSQAGIVKLTVYDILGRVVSVLVNQNLNAGTYNISFSNMGLSSGVYFYELTAGGYREIKKMNLIK